MSGNIPKRQITSRNTIEQQQHEDTARARRVIPVDSTGEFISELNPLPVQMVGIPPANYDEIKLTRDGSDNIINVKWFLANENIMELDLTYDANDNLMRVLKV